MITPSESVYLQVAREALNAAADGLHEDNDRAERHPICRKNGCYCADDCPEGCYLVANAEEERLYGNDYREDE